MVLTANTTGFQPVVAGSNPVIPSACVAQFGRASPRHGESPRFKS